MDEQTARSIDRLLLILEGNGSGDGLVTRQALTANAVKEIVETLRLLDLGTLKMQVAQMVDEREERKLEIAEEKKERREQKRDSFLFRVLVPVIQVSLSVLLATIINVYVNRTPTPVDKKIAAEEKETKASTISNQERLNLMDQRLQEIRDRLPPQPPPPRPHVTKSTHHKATKPKGTSRLREGEFLVTRDHLPSMLSSNLTLLPIMKVPQ